MPRRPSKVELPSHVHCVRSKGRAYYYYQPNRSTDRAGKRIRLPDDLHSVAWWEAYWVAAGKEAPAADANAVAELVKAYKASPEWLQLKETTKEGWSIYLRRIDEHWGKLQVRGIEPKHVLALRDRYASQPATANATMRCLSSLLSWSVPRGWRHDNPCREIRPLKAGDGYEPWPMEMVELIDKGKRRDLYWAAALALYSGQRESDCLRMRWDQIRDGVMHVRQKKTNKKVWVPIHAALKPVLAEIPKRATTILTNTDGRPWTRSGFNTSWRRSLPQVIRDQGLVFHGLRKSAVVMLLEAGCTTAEVQAITGQSMEMVEHYAKEVNQRKLAASAILKWENAAGTGIVKPAVKPAPAAAAK